MKRWETKMIDNKIATEWINSELKAEAIICLSNLLQNITNQAKSENKYLAICIKLKEELEIEIQILRNGIN